MQERACLEVKEMLNDKKTEYLESEDLEKVPYTYAFIKESLRLRPTVPLSSRIATKDITLGKYKIPKGTQVAFLYSVMNRDPEKFDYPDEFIPERYMLGSKTFFLIF